MTLTTGSGICWGDERVRGEVGHVAGGWRVDEFVVLVKVCVACVVVDFLFSLQKRIPFLVIFLCFEHPLLGWVWS